MDGGTDSLEAQVLEGPAGANSLLPLIRELSDWELAPQRRLTALHALRRLFVVLIERHNITGAGSGARARAKTRKRARRGGGGGGDNEPDALAAFHDWIEARFVETLGGMTTLVQRGSARERVAALRTFTAFSAVQGCESESFRRMAQSLVRLENLDTELLAIVRDEIAILVDARVHLLRLIKGEAALSLKMEKNARQAAPAASSPAVDDVAVLARGTDSGNPVIVENLVTLLMQMQCDDDDEAVPPEPASLLARPGSSRTSGDQGDDDDGNDDGFGAESSEDEDSHSDVQAAGASGKRRKRSREPTSSAPSPAVQRRAFADAWLACLRLPMSPLMHKRVLLWLPQHVISVMPAPLQLADFLTDSYRQGGIVSILALSSLFILMQCHNLEYPQFFSSLYALVERSTFYAKHRARVFRLLMMCLASPFVPAHVTAAFIKRCALCPA